MKNNIKICSLSLLMLLVFSQYSFSGNKEQANTSGKAFADSINNSKVNGAAQNTKVQNIPHYQGTNIKEKDHYGSGLGIQDSAYAESQTNETAKFIKDSRKNRPKFKINPETDPLFKRKSDIEKKSNSLANTYSGCVSLPVGTKDITKFSEKTCHLIGKQDRIDYSCNKDLTVTCRNENAGKPNLFKQGDFTVSGSKGIFNEGWNVDEDGHYKYWRQEISLPFSVTAHSINNYITYGTGQKQRSGDCTWYTNYIQFYLPSVRAVRQMVLEQVQYDDWLFIWVNGDAGFQSIGAPYHSGFDAGWKFPGNYKCETGQVFTRNINLNIKPKLQKGWNTIQIKHLVSGRGMFNIKIRTQRVFDCNERTTTGHSCPNNESHKRGKYISKSCNQPGGIRYVKGLPIYRNCWGWKENYYRLTDPYYLKDSECKALEKQGCGQKKAVCIKKNASYCEDQVITYSCPYISPEREVSLCGDQLVCADGKCSKDYGQTYTPATNDFKKAATGMTVANEISKHMDKKKLTVFNGGTLSCVRKPVGFSNCCKNYGWGNDIGLSQCNSDEKKLGLMIQAKRNHYVDEFCNDERSIHKPWGGKITICLSYKKVHCIFPSKLARILVEQGKAQMGRDFGTAEHPNCSGFKMEELNKLDFDTMDLSEFYSDVMDKANNGSTPNASSLVGEIKEKIKSRHPQVKDN